MLSQDKTIEGWYKQGSLITMGLLFKAMFVLILLVSFYFPTHPPVPVSWSIIGMGSVVASAHCYTILSASGVHSHIFRNSGVERDPLPDSTMPDIIGVPVICWD